MNDEIRFGVSELAEAAGVSVRTVRYYITEGLLPPPVTAGAKSFYTGGHRDRLIVIGRLKDAFLPLREIRRQLAEMDDAAIHELAEHESVSRGESDTDMLHSGMLPAPVHRIEESDQSPGFIYGEEDILPSSSPRTARHRDTASDYISRVLKRTPVHAPTPLPSLPQRPPEPVESEHAVWRRIPIRDGAELLIREDLYLRRENKVAWFVDWAKKVLS